MTGRLRAGEQQESDLPAGTFGTSRGDVRLRTVHLPSPLARWMLPYAGLVVVDLRGQGRSGGRSTLGDLEPLDAGQAARIGAHLAELLGRAGARSDAGPPDATMGTP